MPNLVPPVVPADQALAYRGRIEAAMPEGARFTPLMTLYLTEQTDPKDVARAHAEGIATAVKLYPAGATTNSASGVRDFDKVRGVLETMAEKEARPDTRKVIERINAALNEGRSFSQALGDDLLAQMLELDEDVIAVRSAAAGR